MPSGTTKSKTRYSHVPVGDMRGSKRYMKITFSISFSWNNKIEATQNEVESHFKCGSNLSFFVTNTRWWKLHILKWTSTMEYTFMSFLLRKLKKVARLQLFARRWNSSSVCFYFWTSFFCFLPMGGNTLNMQQRFNCQLIMIRDLIVVKTLYY